MHFDNTHATEALRVTLTRDGSVTLYIGRRDQPPTAEPAAAQAVEGAVSAPEPLPHAEHQRLTLAGRVGATPVFRTPPKGTLVARFPLGVKDAADLDTTTWHTVLAFNERAEKVRTSVKKGAAVEVVGYRHTREAQTKDGKRRTIEEIYATVGKVR